MNKQNFMITLDSDVLIGVKEVLGKGNISKAINKHLKNIINSKKDDLDAVSIKLLENEKDGLLFKLNKINSRLSIINEKLDSYKDLEQKKARDLLEKEKKEQEKANTCMNCSNISTKIVKIPYKNNEISLCSECNLVSGNSFRSMLDDILNNIELGVFE